MLFTPLRVPVAIDRWHYMGVSKNKGTPKWMVYFMENPIKMDDLGGKPPIFGNTHTSIRLTGIPKEIVICHDCIPGRVDFRLDTFSIGIQSPCQRMMARGVQSPQQSI